MKEIRQVNRRICRMLAVGLTTVALGLAQSSPVRSPKLLNSVGMRVIPQLVDGGLTRSILIFTNTNAATNAHFHINFYNDDGSTAQFTIKELGGAVDHVDGTIAPGGTWFLTTASTSPINQQGWAKLDGTTDSSVGVIEIIQVRSSTNGPFSGEATVEAVDPAFNLPIAFPFDNTGGNVSSMAIASTNVSANETVNVLVKDEFGNTLLTDSITMKALNHTAFILTDKWAATANKRGTLIFTPPSGVPNTQLSLMALRFESLANGFTVTALPPIQTF